MSVPAELISGLKVRYGEPQRYYHTWGHIEALLGHFEDLRDEFHDPHDVEWALYYHDAIYDPKAPDNEEKSADLFREEGEIHMAPEYVQFIYDIIIGTKRHELVGDYTPEAHHDMALFLDIDLSILAVSEDAFYAYEMNVRAEYAFVPEEAFRAGRSAILKAFLNRPRIYYSDVCYDQWEAPARVNLTRSIERLSS